MTVRRSGRLVALLVLLALGVAGGYLALRRARTASLPDAATYQQLVSTFYRGLGALDTGLLDNATTAFARSTELAPEEPATWVNLGVARLRGGQFEPAASAIARASSLAPRNVDIA